MFDWAMLKGFGEALEWFRNLGRDDVKNMRTEIEDLLRDTGKSLHTLFELEEVLATLGKNTFNREKFNMVRIHCKRAYSAVEVVEKARTHCTDIERDIERINFKAAKVFRTEFGKWKSIEQSFQKLKDSEYSFLREFGRKLSQIDQQLDSIMLMLDNADDNAAWNEYDALQREMRDATRTLVVERKKLSDAENHIRRNLI